MFKVHIFSFCDDCNKEFMIVVFKDINRNSFDHYSLSIVILRYYFIVKLKYFKPSINQIFILEPFYINHELILRDSGEIHINLRHFVHSIYHGSHG